MHGVLVNERQLRSIENYILHRAFHHIYGIPTGLAGRTIAHRLINSSVPMDRHRQSIVRLIEQTNIKSTINHHPYLIVNRKTRQVRSDKISLFIDKSNKHIIIANSISNVPTALKMCVATFCQIGVSTQSKAFVVCVGISLRQTFKQQTSLKSRSLIVHNTIYQCCWSILGVQ